MPAPPPDKYVNDRAEFHATLLDSLQRVKKLIHDNPSFMPFQDLEMQLDAILHWTAHGRDPTPDERQRITIGRITVRELEPAQTDEIWELAQRMHSLNYAIKHWDDYP